MADKKITDLQLISEITTSANFPVDDGTQTYKATSSHIKTFVLAAGNVGLSALAVDILNGLTVVTADDADYFPLADTSDSNKTKKALVSTFERKLYGAVSSFPYTVLSTDGTIKLSGSSGTVTLPTAASISGKKYKFVHAGTSLTQVYTLATTSAQTISGIASGSLALYTNGEVLEVESDGANWIIVRRYVPTNWVSYTPTITGLGSASGLSFYYRRKDPSSISVKGVFTAGTGTAVLAKFTLPGSITADSNYGSTYEPVGQFVFDGTSGNSFQSGSAGSILAKQSDNAVYFGVFGAGGSSAGQAQNGNVGNLGTQTIKLYGDFVIAGWN